MLRWRMQASYTLSSTKSDSEARNTTELPTDQYDLMADWGPADVDALTGPKASAKQVQHVALALRLVATPAAQERLRRLAEDPRLPEHVRTELQR